MSTEFKERVAFVTGAAGGIGRASALAFAARGASVVLCDVVDTGETAAMVDATGTKSLSLEMDVADSGSVRKGIDEVIRVFGRLDFAHNNAGISAMAPLADLDEAVWNRVIAVNLTGVFLCMKYQMPHLILSGGAIVNTASVWAFSGRRLVISLCREQAWRRGSHAGGGARLRPTGCQSSMPWRPGRSARP